MSTTYNTKQYTIGGLKFTVNFSSPFLCFDTKGGSSLYQNNEPNQTTNWTVDFNTAVTIDRMDFITLFIGSDKFEEEMPYKWSIVQIAGNIGIYSEFENNADIKASLAIINDTKNTIDISIEVKVTKQQIVIDPFFHPIGIHILQYITQIKKGFIIHASTVNYNNKGYLFSAVSGTGKSTMAGIWKQYGATIINDDRIMVIPKDNRYIAYNTPMPYYQDRSKEVKLYKTFLIKQSSHNYIKQLPILQGTLGLMSNCMQYQYDEKQVQHRLSALQNIAEQCGVYECGFKPDTDIVKLILEQFD